MSAPSPFVVAAAVMFLAGIGIPVGAALNAGLGRELQSPIAATAVLYVLGAVIALLPLLWTGFPTRANFTAVPPQLFAGAVFFLFYVLSVTFLAPKIGIGNAVFFVLLGQIVSSALIDHFGLFGALRDPLTARRTIGLVVMAGGVYLAKRSA